MLFRSLVPFGGVFTGIEDYKGDVELIGRAGGTVYADTIYTLDEFDYTPSSGVLHHARPGRGEPRGTRGDVTQNVDQAFRENAPAPVLPQASREESM